MWEYITTTIIILIIIMGMEERIGQPAYGCFSFGALPQTVSNAFQEQIEYVYIYIYIYNRNLQLITPPPMSSHRNVNSGKPNEKSHPISSHRNVNSGKPKEKCNLISSHRIKILAGVEKNSFMKQM